MSIQKEFILRYQIEGHVRFQIPAQLCDAGVAKVVSDGISAIDGVYRVNLYRSQQKLSIRYQESVTDFKTFAKQLFTLLSTLDAQGGLQPKPKEISGRFAPLKAKASAKMDNFKLTRWAKAKYVETKETVQAATIITKLGLKKPTAFIKDPEKAIIDFLNDVLVLFMIRLHWPAITQQWILRPLQYRYEWMALFYMVFLLVRSRRPKKVAQK